MPLESMIVTVFTHNLGPQIFDCIDNILMFYLLKI